jgi:hypothetical protein
LAGEGVNEENEKEDYEAGGEEEGAKKTEFFPGRCICRLMKAFADKNKNGAYFLVVWS